MHKVVIAVDYNPSSMKVATIGHKIASSLNAHCTLLHIVSETTYSDVKYSPILGFNGLSDLGAAQETAVPEVFTIAKHLLEKYRDQLKDQSIETVIVGGEPNVAILEICNKMDADLLIIGSKHRTGFERMMVGNLSEKIINTCNIPLLIIPLSE